MNRGIRVLQTLALPLGYVTIGDIYIICGFSEKVHIYFFPMPTLPCGHWTGAGNEARTRYLHLGKVALYQMSYARRWCPEPESNQRHVDFQSTALPTELSGQIFRPAKRRGRGISTPKGTHEMKRHPVGDGDPERARTVDL